ncbi:MAG: prephenate dehydrogenase/arogenate dehydrogenase family protein [Candidatus Dadabacteria bacterium]|nr:prephenate dehydrogenase/arogenate dehydrogenase family protein [Candidatus Dadabacteria bacterium]
MLFDKVTIVGLGLIGGSLAWALRESGEVRTVYGVDSDPGSVDYAVETGIVDEGSIDTAEAASGAEVIVAATYVGGIADTVKSLIPHADDGALITDVGSVKAAVVREIEGFIPERLGFVGGHPIAGTENSGVRNAVLGLFGGKRFILTPTAKTPEAAKEKVRALWRLAGSDIYEMDPDSHDRIFGLVSHLPHAAAYALVDAILSSGDPDPLFDFAGGGLRDYTRVASSSPEMWADIMTANRDNVLGALRQLTASLSKIESALEKGDREELLKIFNAAAETKKDRIK